MTTRSKAGIFKPKLYAATLAHKEPDSVYEAMQNPKWLTTMREEYAALIQNDTWSLISGYIGWNIILMEVWPNTNIS